MPSYQEVLHEFCGQFCARKPYSKTTLWRWKCQRELENPHRRCLQGSIASDPWGRLPVNAEIGFIPTVWIFTFLTTLYSHYWDYFTCVLVDNAGMSESGIKEMENPARSRDSLLRTCFEPELMKRLERSSYKRKKRYFHLDDFSLWTTLCEDCFTSNVYRTMTSSRMCLALY